MQQSGQDSFAEIDDVGFGVKKRLGDA